MNRRIIIIVGILIVVLYLCFYRENQENEPVKVMVDPTMTWRGKILSVRSQLGFGLVLTDKWIDDPNEHQGADIEQIYKDIIENNNLTVVETTT